MDRNFQSRMEHVTNDILTASSKHTIVIIITYMVTDPESNEGTPAICAIAYDEQQRHEYLEAVFQYAKWRARTQQDL